MFTTTPCNVTIPVATRAVGFSTAEVIERLYSIPYNHKRLPSYTESLQFQMYRVQLAMVEYAVHMNRRQSCIVFDSQDWSYQKEFDEFQRVISSMNCCARSTKELINSLRIFQYEQTTYVPLFCNKKFDERGKLIPLPEQIYLTNLRDTVTSLADPSTRKEYRQNFKNRNPLPGAAWGDEDVLLNPDDFISANFSSTDLMDDISRVREWMNEAMNLTFGRSLTDINLYNIERLKGNESMLLSKESETMRLDGDKLMAEEYRYWTMSRISKDFVLRGCYHLGGEIASIDDYRYPAYSTRMSQNAVARGSGHHISALTAMTLQ